MTPGKALEERLNREYGPGSRHYDELARLVRNGLRDGWVANIEINGPKYRRSRVSEPIEQLKCVVASRQI